MIVLDTSALIAIIFDEPERKRFREILELENGAIVNAATMIEARMVSHGRAGSPMVGILEEFVTHNRIKTEALTEEHVEIAHHAFVRYGKGSGHRAQLNFGDLFSYALAKARDLPLLYKGNDFSHTDVKRHKGV